MKCPECGCKMNHQTWDELVTVQGKSITVHSVNGHRCKKCGEAVFDDESYDRVVSAGDGLVRALRKSHPPEIRIIREKLGLTQAEAGKIFGGGVNAFSRYECGAAKPSTQMRKLLKIAERHPELVKELADIR